MSTLFLTAGMVFLAEMGDKTQLIAMAFVAQFGVWRVLGGISAAIIVNTALAVALGEGITRLVPFTTIQMVAGLGFLAFGLWSLRCGEGEECETPGECQGNPFWTVFIAFFVAELGDKTQLVTLGLAAQQGQPTITFLGASLGLITAGALGIFLSGVISRFISPRIMQLGAASLFFIFGSITLYQSLPTQFVNPLTIVLYTLLLSASIYAVHYKKILQ